MSTTTNQTAEKMTLLAFITKKLKLDDAGRVEKFLKNNAKFYEQEVKTLDANRKTEELKQEIALDKLNSKLEDAMEAYNDSFGDVDVELLKTNTSMAAYRETFMNGIEAAAKQVDLIQDEIETTTESFDEFIKENKEQIENYQGYIAKMTDKAF